MAASDVTRFNVGFCWFAAVQFGVGGLVLMWVVEPWLGAVVIAFAAIFALGAGSSRRQGDYDRELERGRLTGAEDWPALPGFWPRLVGTGVLVLMLVAAALVGVLWVATVVGTAVIPVAYLSGRRVPVASRERQDRVGAQVAADPFLSPGGDALQGLTIVVLLAIGTVAVLSFGYGDWIIGGAATLVFVGAAVGAAFGLRAWGRRWRRRAGLPEKRVSPRPHRSGPHIVDGGGRADRARSLKRRTALVVVTGIGLLVLAGWAISQGDTLVGIGIIVLYTPLVIATVIALRTALRA